MANSEWFKGFCAGFGTAIVCVVLIVVFISIM